MYLPWCAASNTPDWLIVARIQHSVEGGPVVVERQPEACTAVLKIELKCSLGI